MERFLKYDSHINSSVNKYYGKYKYIYDLGSMSQKDLKQEVYLELYRIIPKIDNEPEKEKTFVYNNITFTLKSIQFDLARRYSLVGQNPENKNVLPQRVGLEELDFDTVNISVSNIIKDESLINLIKQIITPEEWVILEERLLKNKKWEFIAKKLGYKTDHRSGCLRKSYNRILKKIRKKIKVF